MTARYLACALVVTLLACTDGSAADTIARADAPLPDCEWCGATEAPEDLDGDLTIAGPDEPGERLVVDGRVVLADGTTPAPGVVVYAYHTDARGIYPKRGDETGNARRHGYLRGWLESGPDGRYRIDTIRPASYPSQTEEAHIHLTVLVPGQEEYWLPSIVFADDPLLTDERRREPGVVDVERGEDGVWRGRHDIVLER